MSSNKDIVRRIYDDVLNGRNLDLLDELVRPDYIEHYPLPGQGTGLQGIKDRYTMVIKSLDPHFTVEDVIAEDDKVVVRWTNSGTNVGEFLGAPDARSASPASTYTGSSTASSPSTGTSSTCSATWCSWV